ncbi:MAG: hypothetical protein MJ222_05090 [Bacilli bacterium]|nr:hypothetical protein [Bacilli bacterium]
MKQNSKILVTMLTTTLFAGVLSGCGHEHTFSDAWSSDKENHWHAATCEHTDEKKDLGAHVDADGNYICDVCEYQMERPIVSEFVVKVYEKTGVKAHADVSKAKAGETVTVTIDSVSDGYILTAVKMNDSKLTADAANPNVYKFTMPNQSAVITFDLSVSGDVVIDGDFSVELQLNASTGIYEAKNVLVVNDPNKDAFFDVKIGSTKLEALDLCESKSFGDVGCTFTGSKEFYVKAHNSYDFYFDPKIGNDDEGRFYVQRVGVDVLPSTVDELSSLLVTGYAVRSEVAMYSGVTSMDLKIDNIDGSENTDIIHQQYTWNKYANDVSFGKVIDSSDTMGDPVEKYVYKKFDRANGVFEVVDTYNRRNGNLLANDDPYREDYNKYGAYAAKFGIVSGDDYDYRRFNMNTAHAERKLNTGAHMPVYYIEREIMDSYRVGYEGSDEMNWNDRKIVSTRNPDSSFTVAIDTKVEYKLVSGSGADASQAWVFDVDLGFDKRGAMTSISYKKMVYKVDAWNFVEHTPVVGKQGTTVKKLSGTYGYAAPASSFSTDVFDPSPYFISKINAVRFYNPATKKPKDDGNSYVQLGDDISLYNDEFEKNENVVFDYSPATALDIWQYAPTASSNEDVLVKEANDLYYQMSAVNEGDAVVTISNHHAAGTAAAGVTFDVSVNVSTKVLLREFYLSPVDNPYDYITVATPVNVKAGGIKSYNVFKTPSASPMKYTAVSSNPSIAKITSAPNAKILTIDFSAATSITDTAPITITFESDKYDPDFGGKATVLNFYVIPNDVDPTGKWGLWLEDKTLSPDEYVEFTTNFVEGSVTEKIGYVHSYYSESKFMDATFAYTFDGLELKARVTSITIRSSESWSTDPNDYVLVFEYHPKYELGPAYGVGLAEYAYYSDYGGYYYSEIIGEWDETDGLVKLDPFGKMGA